MKPGFWPDLAKMQQTIHDAGYKPIEGGVALRVSGKLVKQGEVSGAGVALELDGMKSPISLTLAAAKEAPDLLSQLASRVGEAVELEGRWSAGEAGQSGSLAVTAIYGAAARSGSE